MHIALWGYLIETLINHRIWVALNMVSQSLRMPCQPTCSLKALKIQVDYIYTSIREACIYHLFHFIVYFIRLVLINDSNLYGDENFLSSILSKLLFYKSLKVFGFYFIFVMWVRGKYLSFILVLNLFSLLKVSLDLISFEEA